MNELTQKEAYNKYLEMKGKELTKEQIKSAFEKAKQKQVFKQPKKEFVK